MLIKDQIWLLVQVLNSSCTGIYLDYFDNKEERERQRDQDEKKWAQSYEIGKHSRSLLTLALVLGKSWNISKRKEIFLRRFRLIRSEWRHDRTGGRVNITGLITGIRPILSENFSRFVCLLEFLDRSSIVGVRRPGLVILHDLVVPGATVRWGLNHCRVCRLRASASSYDNIATYSTWQGPHNTSLHNTTT